MKFNQLTQNLKFVCSNAKTINLQREFGIKIFFSKKRGFFTSQVYLGNKNCVCVPESLSDHYVGFFHYHWPGNYLPSFRDIFNYLMYNLKYAFIGTPDYLAIYRLTPLYTSTIDKRLKYEIHVNPQLLKVPNFIDGVDPN